MKIKNYWLVLIGLIGGILFYGFAPDIMIGGVVDPVLSILLKTLAWFVPLVIYKNNGHLFLFNWLSKETTLTKQKTYEYSEDEEDFLREHEASKPRLEKDIIEEKRKEEWEKWWYANSRHGNPNLPKSRTPPPPPPRKVKECRIIPTIRPVQKPRKRW